MIEIKRLSVFRECKETALWRRVEILSFSVNKPHCVVRKRRDWQWEFRKTKKPGNELYIRIRIREREAKKINIKRILMKKYATEEYIAMAQDCQYVIEISEQPIPEFSKFSWLYVEESVYNLDETIFPPGHILHYLLQQKLKEINRE